jgi:hypothetical protein
MVTKRMSRIRWLLVAASLCAVCVPRAFEIQTPLITFTAGAIPGSQLSMPATRMQTPAPRNFSEFIVDEDGSVLGFEGNVRSPNPVYRWRAGKWSKDETMRTEVEIRDAIQAPDGKWFVVGRRSQDQAMLYRYDGSNLSLVTTIAGSHAPIGLTLHLAPDGTVWVASGPTVYGVKGGTTIAHELFPGISPQTFASSYSLPISLPVPGHGLWFWSPADSRQTSTNPQLAVNGPRYYEDGQWRATPGPSAQLSGAILIDSDTILCATRNSGMFSLSLSNGSIKDVPWTLPEKESCVFLHSTPPHRMLAITANSAASPWLMQNSDGTAGKLVVFDNGRARVLLDGIDLSDSLGMRGASQFSKGRPVVDTPQGTFIATVGRGIVFVSSDASQARRFDWRYDIPTSNVARMRVRGNLLYLMDNNTGLAIVDWTKLLRMPEPAPKQDSWKIYAAAAQPAAAPDGTIWWLDRSSLPGQLNRWRDGKQTSVPLEGSRFDTLNIRSVAADSKGGVWLLYDSAAVAIPSFRNGEWHVFNNGELAWSSLALEEKDNPLFRFAGSGMACPVFGGNGRVAYRDLMKGARYFDGAAWQTIPQPNGRGFIGMLSFENGVLTMGDPNGYFQFIEGKWQPRSEPTARSSGVQPFSADAIAAPPEDFPGDRSRCRIFLSDAANTLWVGNLDELYRGTENEWVRFPTIGTPLFTATYLTQVLVDDSGDLWFVMNNMPFPQLAHYRGGGKAPTMEWIKAPPTMTKTAKIELSCRVSGSMDARAVLRYRVDEGIWRKIPLASFRQQIAVDNLPNGMHKVEIRAYDALLRSSLPLVAAFEVKRDYDVEIKDLILQLGDSNKREAAARALALIGRPAVPALTAQKEKVDSQLRWWIQAVLDEISREN